ncbi:Fungal specific transcription factor [Cordyceps fumosorosea ARSEF 2679]|uniref:Fungal specific transcription factor n=1 Tax=Cordyceps fumosorosea (strain ARSEF 2679) TaxID=1081104 RepID=A0A167LCH2_CORFA|nr:Fungal specific transcription factor [Cordyceps fumosorosea ARSEF 2679]OAA52924.1 Fungal specific transcription factor [Cordyceps fumosorosea ARSEF 2679]
MKPKSACDTCRDRRRKCIRSQQGTTCDFCAERNLPCNLTRETVFQATGYEPIVPWRSHALTHKCRLLPPTELCLEAIHLYFRYVHVSFHVLFHKPSFLRAFRDGSLPKILLFAVMGMAVRLSKHESQVHIPPKERGRPFTKEAERLLDLHDVSLTTIQSCLLLGASAVVEGESATESVYFSIACRMAVLLDLPNVKVTTQIEQEVHRRVWWSVYETDTWSSTAVRLPKMMPFRNVPLPLAEDAFLALSFTQPAVPGTPTPQQGSPGQPPLPVPSPDSLIAQAMKIGLALSKIDQINSLAASGTVHYVDLIPQVEATYQELHSWQRGLPATMANTADNLAHWTGKDQGHIFVFLHMNYHHLCQLLFYQFIHHSTHDEACPPRAAQFAALCRDSSSQLCELMHRAGKSPGAELLNSLVGHILAIASTVQLHALLFGEDDTEMRNARRLLEQNFELLKRLETYWPCIDMSFARFEAFHNACLRFQDGSQFRMDRWMLTFLLEFATAISESRTAEGSNNSGAPQSWRNIISGQ